MAVKGLNYNRISAEQYVRAAGDYAGILEIRENNTEQIAKAIKTALAAALEEVGLAAEGFAKKKLTENHSVDTGRLRNSVTHAIDMGEEAVYIGTNVEYAPYVELGTSRSKEKPYLRPAAQDHETEYRAIFEKHLGGTS